MRGMEAWAAVLVMACGCSSTTNVTNVYVSDDAGADVAPDAREAGEAGDAAVSGTAADADAADGAAYPPGFKCYAPSDCASGEVCCAYLSQPSRTVGSTGCALVACATWFPPGPSGGGVYSCNAVSDCPSGYSACCHDSAGRGFCDNGC